MADNIEFEMEDENLSDEFDEALESVLEAIAEDVIDEIHHLSPEELQKQRKLQKSAAYKLKAKKYRRAIAKGLRRVNKARSKAAKKAAKYRRESVELTDEELDEMFNAIFTEDEVADFDDFCEEAYEGMVNVYENDEELKAEMATESSELDEFQHMSSTARRLAAKWRNSAAGKRSLAKSARKRKARRGRPQNLALSRKMKQVAKFRRKVNASVEEASELGLSEEQLAALNDLIFDIAVNADEILEDVDVDTLKSILSNTYEIEVPVEDDEDAEEALEDLSDDIELVSNEDGMYTVRGTIEALRCFLDEVGFEDSELTEFLGDNVSDTDAEEIETAVEARQSADSKRYNASPAAKLAKKKYAKKAAKTGYKVDKSLSKAHAKAAKMRVEAIKESLDEQFASTPFFTSLNEAESIELKSIIHNAVSDILDKSVDSISSDVAQSYQDYMNEEVMPTIMRVFEDYKKEIVRNLNEEAESYLTYVSEQIVNDLADKQLIVKSQRSMALESFQEDLLDLIKDKLNIMPEQEDILVKNEQTIKSLTNSLQEEKIEKIRLRNKLEEQQRKTYVMENMPEDLSDMRKESIMNYVDDVLSEAESFSEFRRGFDAAIQEAVSMSDTPRMRMVEEDEDEHTNRNFSSLAEELFRMGR